MKGWVGEVVDRLGGLRLIETFNQDPVREKENLDSMYLIKRSHLFVTSIGLQKDLSSVAEIQTTDANEFILSRLANGSNQKICPLSLV